MLGQDQPGDAGQRLGPEGRGLGVVDAHGVRVDLADLDVLVGSDGDHSRRRVTGIGGGEHHVVGGEGLAVVPGDALLQLPGHALAVGRQAAVGAAGDLGSEPRDQVAFAVPAGQRLVEDMAGVLVLGAAGIVRVQVHGGLPVQQLERAATAALGGFVGNAALRLCQALVHQHHRGHRRRQSQHHHLLDEATAWQLAGAHVFDQCAQFTFFLHGGDLLASGVLSGIVAAGTRILARIAPVPIRVVPIRVNRYPAWPAEVARGRRFFHLRGPARKRADTVLGGQHSPNSCAMRSRPGSRRQP